MNPTSPIQGMQGLMGKVGGAPKLNLQKLHDAYKSIQELRMFASPSVQQLLDQIPNPLHPEYTDPEEMVQTPQMPQEMGQTPQMGGMMGGQNG